MGNRKKMLTYKVCANRFMHHMIRYLVGTMVAVSEGRFSIKHFKTLLHEPQKNVQIHQSTILWSPIIRCGI